MKTKLYGKEMEVHFYQYGIIYPCGYKVDDYLTTAQSLTEAKEFAIGACEGIDSGKFHQIQRISIVKAQAMLDAQCVNQIRHPVNDYVNQ